MEIMRSLEMRAAGMTARQIASAIGRSAQQVYARWHRYGHARKRLTAGKVSLLHDRIRSGRSDAAIAKEFGITPNAVSYHRKRFGYPALSPSEAVRVGNRTRRTQGWQTYLEERRHANAIQCGREGWPLLTAGLRRVMEAVEAGHDTADKLAAATGMKRQSAREKLRVLRQIGHLTAAKLDAYVGDWRGRRRVKVYELAAAVKLSRGNRSVAS